MIASAASFYLNNACRFVNNYTQNIEIIYHTLTFEH